MSDIPLQMYFERLIANLEKRQDDKAVEQERALNLALEVQNAKFLTSTEFRVALRNDITALKERMDKLEGAGVGIKGLVAYIIAAVGLALSVLLLFVGKGK